MRNKDAAYNPVDTTSATKIYAPLRDIPQSRSFQPVGENFNLTAGNATTDPQKTTNKEIGAKLDLLGGRATATAASPTRCCPARRGRPC
ncbi:hypothetical protein [Acidovorax sp. SDU_ACID1]|uniref:hypothetical protein n=1 Tax=Acidovorax sp. SDU_ACID1 TaxID=3136632 RepID=UPI0038731E14